MILSLQRSEDDVSQFDTKFTKQIPVDSPEESMLSESANMMFQVTLNETPSHILAVFLRVCIFRDSRMSHQVF